MTYPQLKAMANRMKRRRESLGFTQERFSEEIELSVSSYTKIENAFQKPRLDTLITIAHHLHESLDYLVFGKEGGETAEDRGTDTLNALLNYADGDKLLHASRFLAKIAKVKEAEKS
ncbi:MAG: helix-turn-helix transcriptional regulator [Oscillospiraceae bacterium]|nr:helix-turn-helix transcriptional regulator [Oscillospiraceae bacterium]